VNYRRPILFAIIGLALAASTLTYSLVLLEWPTQLPLAASQVIRDGRSPCLDQHAAVFVSPEMHNTGTFTIQQGINLLLSNYSCAGGTIQLGAGDYDVGLPIFLPGDIQSFVLDGRGATLKANQGPVLWILDDRIIYDFVIETWYGPTSPRCWKDPK
jgi:hypothetical protein